MSELDKHFGPAPDVAMPTAQPTAFGRYPARIRAVADAFMEEMGWHCDPTTKRSVAAGAKRFVDVHGDNPGLLVRGIKKLRNTAPHIYDNIASPGSLITPCRRMGADPDSVEARQRYVTGEFADFFGENDE